MPSAIRESKAKYWINTISLNHVKIGVEGGFTQAGHGKNTGLKRLSKGDWMVFYSPRTEFGGGDPLQEFTAMGRVMDDASYQAEMSPDFHPWRRTLKFMKSTSAPIQPLIGNLEFIKDKKSWGFPFRRGLFEIPKIDFMRIARAMKVNVEK